MILSIFNRKIKYSSEQRIGVASIRENEKINDVSNTACNEKIRIRRPAISLRKFSELPNFKRRRTRSISTSLEYSTDGHKIDEEKLLNDPNRRSNVQLCFVMVLRLSDNCDK